MAWIPWQVPSSCVTEPSRTLKSINPDLDLGERSGQRRKSRLLAIEIQIQVGRRPEQSYPVRPLDGVTRRPPKGGQNL
jgi:hypothetical protein